MCSQPILDLVELTETTEHLTFSAEETLRYDFAKFVPVPFLLPNLLIPTQ